MPFLFLLGHFVIGLLFSSCAHFWSLILLYRITWFTSVCINSRCTASQKKHAMCSWEWTQKSTKQNATENNQETKIREEKNWTIEEHSVKPQHRDQSKRLLWHRPINSTKDFSESSRTDDYAPSIQSTSNILELNSKYLNHVSQANDSNKIIIPPQS